VVGLGCLGVAAVSSAEEAPQHVELLLAINKNEQLTVLRQTPRSGRVPGPNHPEFREGFLAFQAQDEDSHDLYTTTVPDPRLIYVDWLAGDPTEPERLTGGTTRLDDAVFAVRLPRDPRITRVKYARLKRTVTPSAPDPRVGPSRSQWEGAGAAGSSTQAVALPEDALDRLGSISVEIR
jgi:hypothetical protein